MYKRENQLRGVTNDDVHNFMQLLGSEGVTYDEFYQLRNNKEKMRILGRTIRTISRLFKDEEIDKDFVNSLNQFFSEKGMDQDLIELLLMEYGWHIKVKNGLWRENKPVTEYLAEKTDGLTWYSIIVVLKAGESINRIFSRILLVEVCSPGKDKKVLTNLSEEAFKDLLLFPEQAYKD